MSGLDAGFLYLEAAGTPMHVGGVMQIAPVPGRQGDFCRDLVAHLARRLPDTPVLRRVLQAVPLNLDHPGWRELESMDPARHVLRRKLAAPGSRRQLDALVARLHAIPLDRDRPLWQFVVIEGLATGELALYAKIHHAVLDGHAGAALAQALLDAGPQRLARTGRDEGLEERPDPTPPRDTAAHGSERGAAGRLLRLWRAVSPMLMSAAAAREASLVQSLRQGVARLRDSVSIAPRTRFNRQVSERRSFASLSLPLDSCKQIARFHEVSLNDVVMALCAGALRRFLLAAGELPHKPLVAAMPVSLRAPGDTAADNQVSMVQCPLPTDLEDPLARLQTLAAATRGLKRRVGARRGLLPTDFPGLAAPVWATALARLWGRGKVAERLPSLANLVVSNVPGPPQPLYLAGARITHYFPVSIVTHGLGLNITVQSYAGMLEFGLTACREALPRPDVLAQLLQRELELLLESVPR